MKDRIERNNEQYDDSLRSQYLVYLHPEEMLIHELCSFMLRDHPEQMYFLPLKSTDLQNYSPREKPLGLHCTINGFYSYYKKLGLNSESELESEIIDVFNKLTTSIDSIKIKNPAEFKLDSKSTIALLLENSNLRKLNIEAVDGFKHLIVLKGGILARDDEKFYRERYKYSGEKYNPHISVCKSPQSSSEKKVVLAYLREFSNKKYYFSKLVLSKKCKDGWKMLSSKDLS